LADFLANCVIAFPICALMLQKCAFRYFGPLRRASDKMQETDDGRGGAVYRRICAIALLVVSLVAGAAARAAEPVAPPCKNGAATCMPWERDWSNTTLPPGSVVTGQGVIYGPPANPIVNFLYNW
jgi:hypothetical protein